MGARLTEPGVRVELSLEDPEVDASLIFEIWNDGVPILLSLKSRPPSRGWGTALLVCLSEMYGTRSFLSTPINTASPSGICFWLKMHEEYGFDLCDDKSGVSLLAGDENRAGLRSHVAAMASDAISDDAKSCGRCGSAHIGS